MDNALEKNSLISFEKEVTRKQKIFNIVCQTPGYANNIPKEGVRQVINMADALGIPFATAFNGGLYCVKGKVEMSSRLMNSLIRSKGHSVQMDPKSDEKMCILHGKRGDNGDVWVAEFSMEEAHRANLTNNPTWKVYPKDMLFARALSRLARQLFPDVIQGCYVEGEIKELKLEEAETEEIKKEAKEKITPEHLEELEQLLNGREDFKDRIMLAYRVLDLSELDDEVVPVIKNGIEVLKKRETINAKVAEKEVANESP